MGLAQSAPQGTHYRADVIYLLLTGNTKGSRGLMVLRVKPTPTQFPTNSLYTPMDNTLLHSLSSVGHSWVLWPNRSILCVTVSGKIPETLCALSQGPRLIAL